MDPREVRVRPSGERNESEARDSEKVRSRLRTGTVEEPEAGATPVAPESVKRCDCASASTTAAPCGGGSIGALSSSQRSPASAYMNATEC